MNNETILIVDDNEDIRNFVRLVLEPEGYRIVEAVDGNEALAKTLSAQPDLIILDLSIGQPDGMDVCRTIRKNSMVPIIILTSHNGEVDEAMCLALGADDFIVKPVGPRILVLRVATQIRHKRALAGTTGQFFEGRRFSSRSRSARIDGGGTSTSFDPNRI